MLKRKSAKNIKDELEVHKLFPLLMTGKRHGCAAAMARLRSVNKSGSGMFPHHQLCAATAPQQSRQAGLLLTQLKTPTQGQM